MPQNQLRRRKYQRDVTSAPSRRRSTDGARARSEGTENHACPPTIVRNMPQNHCGVVGTDSRSRRLRLCGVRRTAPALDRKAPRTTPVRRQLFSVCRATDCGVDETRRHFGTVVAAAARVRPCVIELVPR